MATTPSRADLRKLVNDVKALLAESRSAWVIGNEQQLKTYAKHRNDTMLSKAKKRAELMKEHFEYWDKVIAHGEARIRELDRWVDSTDIVSESELEAFLDASNATRRDAETSLLAAFETAGADCSVAKIQQAAEELSRVRSQVEGFSRDLAVQRGAEQIHNAQQATDAPMPSASASLLDRQAREASHEVDKLQRELDEVQEAIRATTEKITELEKAQGQETGSAPQSHNDDPNPAVDGLQELIDRDPRFIAAKKAVEVAESAPSPDVAKVARLERAYDRALDDATRKAKVQLQRERKPAVKKTESSTPKATASVELSGLRSRLALKTSAAEDLEQRLAIAKTAVSAAGAKRSDEPAVTPQEPSPYAPARTQELEAEHKKASVALNEAEVRLKFLQFSAAQLRSATGPAKVWLSDCDSAVTRLQSKLEVNAMQAQGIGKELADLRTSIGQRLQQHKDLNVENTKKQILDKDPTRADEVAAASGDLEALHSLLNEVEHGMAAGEAPAK